MPVGLLLGKGTYGLSSIHPISTVAQFSLAALPDHDITFVQRQVRNCASGAQHGGAEGLGAGLRPFPGEQAHTGRPVCYKPTREFRVRPARADADPPGGKGLRVAELAATQSQPLQGPCGPRAACACRCRSATPCRWERAGGDAKCHWCNPFVRIWLARSRQRGKGRQLALGLQPGINDGWRVLAAIRPSKPILRCGGSRASFSPRSVRPPADPQAGGAIEGGPRPRLAARREGIDGSVFQSSTEG
jgi:hypothetical protein